MEIQKKMFSIKQKLLAPYEKAVASKTFDGAFSFSSFTSDNQPLTNTKTMRHVGKQLPDERARRRVAQLEDLDHGFMLIHRLFAGTLDEKRTMMHVSQSADEVIKALRKRIHANQDVYLHQLETSREQLDVEAEKNVQLGKELKAMTEERDAAKREIARLNRDMQTLTFTVKQLQRTYRAGLIYAPNTDAASKGTDQGVQYNTMDLGLSSNTADDAPSPTTKNGKDRR